MQEVLQWNLKVRNIMYRSIWRLWALFLGPNMMRPFKQSLRLKYFRASSQSWTKINSIYFFNSTDYQAVLGEGKNDVSKRWNETLGLAYKQENIVTFRIVVSKQIKFYEL